jgi:hypothetical protein
MRPLAATLGVVCILHGCSYLVSSSQLATPITEAGTGDEAAPTDDAPTADDAGQEADTGIADPHLLGAWSFDEGSGTVAHDSSGHGIDAVLGGGASFISSGVRGGAVAFHGSDWVAIDDLSFAAFPPSGTLSIWFRWNTLDPSGEQVIFETWDSTRSHVFLRHANGEPQTRFQVAMQPAGNLGYVWVTDFETVQNQWAHAVIIWSATAGAASVFVDGTLVHSAAYDKPFAPTQEVVQLGNWLDGAIDEVRLYDRPFTYDEAMALE